MFKEENIQKLYTDKATLYDRLFNGILRYSSGFRAFFKKSDYLKPNMKILDAGCGSGTLIRNLHFVSVKKKIKTIQFHGFDITPHMLNLFRRWILKNKIKNIDIVKADVLQLNQLPKNWRSYDLIISSAMLEYLPKNKIREAICNLKSLLKSNGVLIIIITRQNPLMKVLIEAWWKANSYNLTEIIKIFYNSGFKLLNFKTFPFPYSHLNLWGYIIELK